MVVVVVVFFVCFFYFSFSSDTTRVSKSLYPDQVQHFVEPDPGQNFCNDTSMQRVIVLLSKISINK